MWVNSFCHFQPFPKITLFCAEQRSPAQVLRFEISQIGWAGLVSRDQIFGVSPRPRVFSLVLVSAPRPAAAQRHGSSSCYFLSLYSPASPFIAARHRWPHPYIDRRHFYSVPLRLEEERRETSNAFKWLI